MKLLWLIYNLRYRSNMSIRVCIRLYKCKSNIHSLFTSLSLASRCYTMLNSYYLTLPVLHVFHLVLSR